MRLTDARKLTRNELTELRKRGVAAVQAGRPTDLVARALRVQRSTLFAHYFICRIQNTPLYIGLFYYETISNRK